MDMKLVAGCARWPGEGGRGGRRRAGRWRGWRRMCSWMTVYFEDGWCGWRQTCRWLKWMKPNVQVDDGAFGGWLVWMEADVQVDEVNEGEYAGGWRFIWRVVKLGSMEAGVKVDEVDEGKCANWWRFIWRVAGMEEFRYNIFGLGGVDYECDSFLIFGKKNYIGNWSKVNYEE